MKHRKRIIDGLEAVMKMRSAATDEQAAACPDVYPAWNGDGKVYTVGERVLHDGTLYKVLQGHASQPAWTPDAAPSLFAPILAGQGGTDVGEWQQPDSTNAYNIGDRCMYNGTLYESTIDGNVWSPTDYPAGWKAVGEQGGGQ